MLAAVSAGGGRDTDPAATAEPSSSSSPTTASPSSPSDAVSAEAVRTYFTVVCDAEAAKDQLGPTCKTVTERHYINRLPGVSTPGI